MSDQPQYREREGERKEVTYNSNVESNFWVLDNDSAFFFHLPSLYFQLGSNTNAGWAVHMGTSHEISLTEFL